MTDIQRFAMAIITMIALCMADTVLAEEGQVSVRALAAEESDMPVWYLSPDGVTYKELKWSFEQPTPAILTAPGEELLLFSKEADEKGEPEFKVARKLPIPEGAKELLLVAWPDEGDAKVGLMVVADNLRQATSHDWILINTSKQVVNLRVGAEGETIRVEPRETKPYRIDADHENGSAVLAQAMFKDDMKTIYSTYWAAPEKQRSLVLFNSTDKRVRLRRVIDMLPAAP